MQLAPWISRGLRGPWRSLGLLWAVALALLSPRAFAAAPLCDPSGASVVAPTPAPPSSTGDWMPAKGCADGTETMAADGPRQDPRPSAQVAPDVPDRVLPVTHALPGATGSSVEDLARALGSPLPGFSKTVYHPPR